MVSYKRERLEIFAYIAKFIISGFIIKYDAAECDILEKSGFFFLGGGGFT